MDIWYILYTGTLGFSELLARPACPRQITAGSSPPGSFCFYKEPGLNATRRPRRHGRELNNCCNNPLPSFMCQKVYMVIYIMWRLECTVNNCCYCVVSSAFKWWTWSFIDALDASLQTTLIEETKGLLVLLTSKTSNFLVPLFRGRALNRPPWKLFWKINTAVHNVHNVLSQIASIQLFWVFQYCLRSS